MRFFGETRANTYTRCNQVGFDTAVQTWAERREVDHRTGGGRTTGARGGCTNGEHVLARGRRRDLGGPGCPSVADGKHRCEVLAVVDKGVNRTSVSRVLTVISVQSPSVDGDACRHLFGISEHVVNRANTPEGPGRIVFKRVHDEVRSGSDAAGIRIARAVSEHGNGDVRTMAAVAVGRRRIKPKLREGGSDPAGQIRMVRIQSCVGNGDHLSRSVERERGVIGHVLNASNGPSQRVVDAPLGGRFGPQNSSVEGQLIDHLGHGEGISSGVAHPRVA